jgi:hypothetical protein
MNDLTDKHVHETITGLRAGVLILAVRKMRISEVKCPNAIRYERRAIS